MNDCVQVKNLEKSFGKSQILHHINLTIGEGEVYGLIGENGAGKTTLLRLISGLMQLRRRHVEAKRDIFLKENENLKCTPCLIHPTMKK